MPAAVRRSALLLPLVAVLAACSPARTDGIDPEGKAFDAVAPEETITLTGTEPFWNIRIAGEEAVWTAPEDPEGIRFPVTRFAGNNGLGFTGTLEGESFTATLTPGNCSDGMSDRTYPFVATIALGSRVLEGCGYTDRQGFTGGEGGQRP